MQRSVSYGPSRIVYHLTRKRVKNINLRVTGGAVRVSAPNLVPVDTVDAFVRRKAAWILAAQQRQRQAAQPEPADMLRFLGNTVPITVSAGARGVALDAQRLHVTLPHPDDAAAVSRLLRQWQRRQCQILFARAVDECLPALAAQRVPRPQIKLRDMKSRWGSCLVHKGVVTFNTRLLGYPYSVIRYVAAHELCHFVHPDHSADFYELLAQVEPCHRALRAALRS
ncbi:MAG: SprT family zinc-dependent metalloprotease [Eubacteriales bacterium]|nr:SprT family zinc-dependent metalloprotease [Eubacteriales bacterium]